jgi:hypothetical protein
MLKRTTAECWHDVSRAQHNQALDFLIRIMGTAVCFLGRMDWVAQAMDQGRITALAKS